VTLSAVLSSELSGKQIHSPSISTGCVKPSKCSSVGANPAQNADADEVAKAEQAAKQQDEPKMRQHLKNAGKFALDCAKTIGTDVAAEYLKKMTLGG
jgi:hypothetical protein